MTMVPMPVKTRAPRKILRSESASRFVSGYIDLDAGTHSLPAPAPHGGLRLATRPSTNRVWESCRVLKRVLAAGKQPFRGFN